MSVPGLVIRPFTPADREPLEAIRAAAFAPVFASFKSMVGGPIADVAFARIEEEQAALLGELFGRDPRRLLVAEHGADIVGFIAYSVHSGARMGEIGLNAVHPDHAGQGIGSALYQTVLDRMKEEGVLVATVGTGGDPSHAAARRAYAKAGFAASIPSISLYREL